jgi:hypothetical protein
LLYPSYLRSAHPVLSSLTAQATALAKHQPHMPETAAATALAAAEEGTNASKEGITKEATKKEKGKRKKLKGKRKS